MKLTGDVAAAVVALTLVMVAPGAGAALLSVDFNDGTLGGGSVAGTANSRSATSAINGPVGFNGFFNSVFAVLGDNGGNILSRPDAGMSSLSYDFVVATTSNVIVSFDYSFSGFDFDPGRQGNDRLSVLLNGPSGTTLLSIASSFTVSTFTFGAGEFAKLLPALPAGAYALTFVLNESDNCAVFGPLTNTAAGLDNIVVDEQRLSAVPLPPALWLLGSALLGALSFRRRRSFPDCGIGAAHAA